ncbi:MAG: TIGR01777 family oxidoreductase [Bacteroidales bacterium]|nr:TIGR01777 family oxidoreductase [Bacteroidales bacterium]
MTKVLITGGTGLVGSHLSKKLTTLGYKVYILSRNKIPENNSVFFWDWKQRKINLNILKQTDYIIHLAGANIGSKRWTNKRKQQIVDSRVESGNFILEQITKYNIPIKAFISASAIGYYGATTKDEIFNEDTPAANDFIGTTCKIWEEMSEKFQNMGIRSVKLRTGIVLSNKGVISKILRIKKFRLIPILGSGKQHLPWIHIEDLCNIYIHAIENTKIQGSFNAVATQKVNYTTFVQTLIQVISKKYYLIKIPQCIIKLLFGEMSKILLEGTNISNDRIKQTGFRFKYPNLNEALINLSPKSKK